MPPKKNLTGLRFGRLTVLYETEQRAQNGNIKWHCRCDCGTECDIIGTRLTHGLTKSCGCLQKEITSRVVSEKNKKDLTGLPFGRLTVLCEYDKSRRHVMWLCQCKCGNFKVVRGSHLYMGNIQSCGCYKDERTSERNKQRTGKNHPSYKDLTGLQFGKLTVMYVAGQDTRGAHMWRCRCGCGNEVDVRGWSLISGATKSCGCLIKKRASEIHKKDLTGLTFGRLTVLCEFGKNKHGQYMWLCKCDCGNFTLVNGGRLTSSHTQSCGCLQKERTSGANHFNWRGGISFEPYCPKFNNNLKEKVRDKYDNKCLICGKTKEENGQNLSVHHVTYNKQDGCNGNGFKLIPLCTSCHAKTNSNRNFWEYYCKYLIKWHEWKQENNQNNEHMVKKLDKRR